MKEIGAGFKKIFREEKGVLLMMGVLFIMGMVLVFHALFHFKFGASTLYVGYADIGGFSGGEFLSLWNSGGYKTGEVWVVMTFPIVGVSLAILYNLLAVQIFNRRGKGYAQIFLLASMIVAGIAFEVLLRLLGAVK